MVNVDISDIINLAFGFECCPFCGNVDLDSSHFCTVCSKRFSVCDDAYWFALFLEKEFGVV